MTAEKFFDQKEIYPGNVIILIILLRLNISINKGSKLRHFKELHKKTGIPYTEMVKLTAYDLVIHPYSAFF